MYKVEANRGFFYAQNQEVAILSFEGWHSIHFRYVIPAKYHNYVRGEIRLSLGTGTLSVARPKSAILAKFAKEYLQNNWCGNDMFTLVNKTSKAGGDVQVFW